MAINPITILPKLSKVDFTDPNQSNFGNRLMEDFYRNELQQQRQDENNNFRSSEGFNEYLGKQDTTGLTPFARAAMAEKDKILAAGTQAYMNAKDPLSRSNAQRDIMLSLQNNEFVKQGQYENALVDDFNKRVMATGHLISPTKLAAVQNKILDETRKTPLTAKDLDLASLYKDDTELATEFVKNQMFKKDKLEVDKETGSIYVGKRTALPSDIEETTFEYLKTISPIDPKDPSAAIREAALRKTAKGVADQAKGRTKDALEIDSVRGIKDPESSGDTWLKNLNKPQGSGLSDGRALHVDKDGNGVVYDKDGDVEKEGSIDEIYPDLPQQDRARLNAGGYNPENYVVPGGRKIIGTEFFDTPMSTSGMAPHDAEKADKESSYRIKEGEVDGKKFNYISTNNPAILQEMGLSLSFSDADGYTLTDKAGNTYKESKDGKGMFSTEGGTKQEPGGIVFDNPVTGTARTFNVKLKDIGAKDDAAAKDVPADTPVDAPKVDTPLAINTDNSKDTGANLPELDFVAAGEAGGGGNDTINPYDAGRPSISRIQINDAEVQHDLMETVGKGQTWDDIVTYDKEARKEITKTRDAMIAEAAKYPPSEKAAMVNEANKKYSEDWAKVSAETKEGYKKIYNGLKPEEKKAFDDKVAQIGENTFWAPSRKVFKEEFGVEIPTKVRGLWAAMAGQHYKGMLGNKELVKMMDADKVKKLVEEGDNNGLIDYISDTRADYLKKHNLANKGNLSRVESDRKLAKGETKAKATTVSAESSSSAETEPSFKMKKKQAPSK